MPGAVSAACAGRWVRQVTTTVPVSSAAAVRSISGTPSGRGEVKGSRRFVAAMVTRRSWTAAEFRELFVAHPLLWHLVRRL
ncbi:DUF4132 domain-containing protein, partial [Streptomyces sp. NPDC003832]